jgi:protein ImuB
MKLWLAIYFPDLPLEIFSRGDKENTPLAISMGPANRPWLLSCNAAARAQGLHPGMSVSAAYALARNLRIQPRDETAEASALEHVAAWAGQFSSLVCLDPPQGILLEVAGSQRLFGGLEPLLQRIGAGVTALGYRGKSAVASTPLAARLLACAGCGSQITDPDRLRSALSQIPLHHLDVDEKRLESLQGLGLHTLGDCLRLPREGLMRRFGRPVLDYFDRMLGRLPDPREPFVPPAHFASHLVLPAEVTHAEALIFAIHRLLVELNGFLLARCAAAQRLELALHHRTQSTTRIRLGLIAPRRDLQHFSNLLSERLHQTQLVEPVQEIGLFCKEIVPFTGQNSDLFQDLFRDTGQPKQSWTDLIERLRARLGDEAVYGICLVPSHRPERAWRRCALDGHSSAPSDDFEPRPLWLLENPIALESKAGWPYWNGPLTLIRGPQCIESGWWDNQEVARDYYLARDAKGSKLWIFRERKHSRQWFMHGVFS